MAFGDNLEVLLQGLNSLEGAEKFKIGQAIFLEENRIENIKDTHPSMGEVRTGNKVPIIGDEGSYDGFPFVEGCALPVCDFDVDVSEHEWRLAEMGCKMEICMKDFSNGFLAFWNVYKRMNEGDIESAVVKYIVQIFQNTHLKTELRDAYFGDMSSDDALINGFNGYVTTMQARAQADDTLLVEITENEGATVAEQMITDGEAVYEYLKAIYTKALTKPWFNPSQMVWRMNEELVSALAGWLNLQSDLKGISCSCIDPSKVINDRVYTADNLAFFGIPIEPKPFTQAQKPIAELYDEGTGLYEHRNIIILARKDAMILGYEHVDSMHQFNIGWNAEDRYIYMNGSSLFGSAVPVDYFVIGI